MTWKSFEYEAREDDEGQQFIALVTFFLLLPDTRMIQP